MEVRFSQGDLVAVDGGTLSTDRVRGVFVKDALVDFGATGLLMPKRLIAQLGLTPLLIRIAKTACGLVAMRVYRTARMTVQGRDCILDVTEIGDDLPVFVGQIPLVSMDWVIDTAGQKLIGNPAHGGEQMIEVYRETSKSEFGQHYHSTLPRRSSWHGNSLVGYSS